MKFILGNFGSGKTRHVLEESLELLNQKKDFWIIVPSRRHKDQLYLDLLKSQKGLLGNPILSLMEFQTFLLENIFPNPADRPQTISNFEKFLIISSIIQDQSSHFKAFHNIEQRPEMIKMIYRLIQSLRDKDTLQLASSEELKDKIEDLQLILDEYQKILQHKNLSDTFFEIDLICKNLSLLPKEFIPPHVFVDGFVDYTATQFKLLSHFANYALESQKKVSITLTDLEHPTSKETIICFEEQFPKAEKIILKSTHPSSHLANSFLEDKEVRENPIKLFEIQAFGTHKEVEYIINQIKKLCLLEDHRLEDIFLITDQQDKYAPLIASALRKADIPFIFGKDDKLSQNPLISFIKRCITLMLGELDHEGLDFFAHSNYINSTLRTTLGLSSELITIPIRGRIKAWEKGLERQNEINSYQEECEKLPEELNTAILELGKHLFALDPYKKYSITKHINNLIALLDFLGLQETLSATHPLIKHKKIIDYSIAKDYSALLKLKTILQELRKSLEMIGHKELNLSSFLFFFTIIADETRYRSEIPQKNVLRILNPRDARGTFVKSVFILGMNEGEFPTPPKFELFDNQDRYQLNKVSQKILGQDLWETDNEYFSYQKLSFATALTRAREQIYFSRTPSNEKGTYFNMSHFLKRIFNKKIPIVRLPHANSDLNSEAQWDNPAIFNKNLLAEEYYEYNHIPLIKRNQDNKHIEALKDYVLMIENTNNIFSENMLPEPKSLAYFGYIPEVSSLTKKYKGSSVYTSPTGLERFGRCRYRGLWEGVFKLKPHKLPTYKPEAADYGNLYHRVLELYIEETKNREEDDFYDSKLLEKILKEYIALSAQSPVFTLDYEYLHTILSLFLKNLEPSLREGQRALFVELESGKGELKNQDIPLNADKSLKAFSRIDRVNQYTSDNSYGVIDYKKGSPASYKSYQKTPFHLFQGFLYGELLKNNNKAPVSSISYAFLEKQEIFKEYPATQSKKNVFNSITEYQQFKQQEILRLLELLAEGNFCPFTLESDVGETVLDAFKERFGEKVEVESPTKCAYCPLHNLCLRQNKKLSSFRS